MSAPSACGSSAAVIGVGTKGRATTRAAQRLAAHHAAHRRSRRGMAGSRRSPWRSARRRSAPKPPEVTRPIAAPVGVDDLRAFARRRAAFRACRPTRRRAGPVGERRLDARRAGKAALDAPPLAGSTRRGRPRSASIVSSSVVAVEARPASSRSESRAPRPIGCDFGLGEQPPREGVRPRRRAARSRSRPRRCSRSGRRRRSIGRARTGRADMNGIAASRLGASRRASDAAAAAPAARAARGRSSGVSRTVPADGRCDEREIHGLARGVDDQDQPPVGAAAAASTIRSSRMPPSSLSSRV